MNKRTIQFIICFTVAFASWSLWCVLMVAIDEPFSNPVVRAIVRFSTLTIPAAIFLWATNNQERPGIIANSKIGLVTGAIVSGAWLLMHIRYSFQLPNTTHAWLNVVTLSPIAEEILFRYTAVNFLLTITSRNRAVLLSALLFAAFHLPWWLISQEKAWIEILGLTGTMFLYGLVFGYLYLCTKSIWSSLLPHVANNMIALSLVR